MSTMNKMDALNNALRSFNFNEKYYIISDGMTGNTFAIVSLANKEGGVSVHSNYMSYDLMNAYLRGYNDNAKGKFKN